MGRILKRMVGDNNLLDRMLLFLFFLFFLVIYVKRNGDLPVG